MIKQSKKDPYCVCIFFLRINIFKKYISLLVFLSFTNSVSAAEQDQQIWIQTVLTSPIIEKDHPLSVSLEYQPRHSNDLSRNDVSILRPALTYKYNSKFSFTLGYFSQHAYDFAEIERRLWQQVQFFEELSLFEYQLRIRLEQRIRRNSIINGTDDSQVLSRIRFAFRLQTKQNFYGFSPFLIDEIMFNIDDSKSTGFSKINAGYDQNRIFLGVTKQIASRLSVDFGYMNSNILKGDGSTFLIHAGFANFLLKL